MKENWLKIKGFEEYEVSDLGRVRSLKFGKVRVLKPGNRGKGYLAVVLCKNGEVMKFYVHTLVIATFKGPIPAGMQVNHRNEDKTDNRLSNLEVVTAKQNCNHGTRNERAGKAIAKALKGNVNASKKLQLTNAKTSAKYTFSNSCEASEFFGYQRKHTVGCYIHYARKRGENFINIRQEKYYFSQEA